MRRKGWIGVLLLALTAASWLSAEEPPGEPGYRFLQRLRPAGGWCPYGCPVHWWRPDCLPRSGAPDDYCRKTLPNVCLPSYPAWYICWPRQDCSPSNNCHPPGNAPR
jgi:hypothetical protein